MAALALNAERYCEDATECQAVDNIIHVLTHYHLWNAKQLSRIGEIDYSALNGADDDTLSVPITQLTKSSASFSTRLSSDYDSVISEFMDDISYTDVSLLNDFGHILNCHHQNDREFEWIYYELTEKLEISSIIDKNNAIVHRTQYSRDAVYEDIELMKRLYYGYYESREIHTFEILDRIYIYFLHSFDFGLRFTANEKMEMEMEQRERDANENNVELIDTPEINIDAALNTIRSKLSKLRRALCEFETFKSRFSASTRFITNYEDVMLLNTTRSRASAKSAVSELKEEDVVNEEEEKEKEFEEEKEKTGAIKFVGASAEAIEANAHLIGRRWHYAQNVFNCTDIDTINGGVSGDWFIDTKYSNIKHEILNNKLYSLSMNGWILNYDYAALMMKSDRAKNTLRVMADRWKTFYDLNQNFTNLPNPLSPSLQSSSGSNIFKMHYADCDGGKQDNKITINHILAILFYCNFNELSRYFRATYLDMDRFGVSRDRQRVQLIKWKQQHSEFANLGRLIREAIEDYGEQIGESQNNLRFFYHGLNGRNDEEIVCSSTMIRFCSALSCCTNSSAAIQMCCENGIILQCKSYTNYLRFFDAKWLSLSHCAESESIFCGGDWPLRINSIYDMRSATTSFNYRYYLCAISILTDLIAGEYNKECEFIDAKLRYTLNQIFSSRLWMRNAIPPYIDKLFERYCNNLADTIEINMVHINVKSMGYREIKSLLFDTDESADDRIKFDVLCCVFNRIKVFKFSHYKITHKNIKSILEFAKNQYAKYAAPPFQSQLKYIVFEELANQKHPIVKNIVKQNQKQFKEIQWFMKYKKKKNGSLLVIGNQPITKINSYDSDCSIM